MSVRADLRKALAVEPDGRALASRAASLFAGEARAAVASRGGCAVALTGGSSPLAMYDALVAPPLRDEVPWSRLEVYFGDERAVPPDAPESNYGAARDRLLAKVPVDPSRVHRMPGERADLEAAAAEYESALRASCGAPPALDVLFLGIGNDGHILSLYPGCPDIAAPRGYVVALRDTPMNPKLDRITFTPALVEHARHVIVLVPGAGKSAALRAMIRGDDDPMKVPAQLVRRARGRVTILADEAAAAEL